MTDNIHATPGQVHVQDVLLDLQNNMQKNEQAIQQIADLPDAFQVAIAQHTVAQAAAQAAAQEQFDQAVSASSAPTASELAVQQAAQQVQQQLQITTEGSLEVQPPAPAAPPAKPLAGTEEWHKMRRDNHKEVERRRRVTINDGINDLASVVPGCEKSKGSILRQAVQYIHDLQTAMEVLKTDKINADKALEERNIQYNELQSEMQKLLQSVEIDDLHLKKKLRTE